MNYKPYLALFIIYIYSPFSFSQNKAFKNEFGFRSDNDAYLAFGQDKYYTNGLFLTFRHALDQNHGKDSTTKKIWEIELGHKMYNPKSGKTTDIDRTDRPFAAYLYAGGSFNWLYNSEQNIKLTLQAGVLGPSALGEEVQKNLHDFIGFYPIKGWENQVKDEFGINTTIEYNRLLNRSKNNKTDYTVISYVNVGSTYSSAGAGLLFRNGLINQLFTSASTNSTISNNSNTTPLKETEFFFFAKPTLNFIAYDGSIQGGMFREEKGPITFDIKHVVFSQELGAIYVKNRIAANFSLIFKSREVKSEAKAHQYGSVALYYRFN